MNYIYISSLGVLLMSIIFELTRGAVYSLFYHASCHLLLAIPRHPALHHRSIENTTSGQVCYLLRKT